MPKPKIFVTIDEAVRFMDDVAKAPRYRDMGISANQIALTNFLEARMSMPRKNWPTSE